ncbi:hypothetical protein ACFWN1_26535 [Streptomyces sp. NPDC058459]|uniref:hypothetical protein n=1 Tax=Streptomyces sp. NPDC058459 TaxID=3346508 RepID=UPI00364C3D6A
MKRNATSPAAAIPDPLLTDAAREHSHAPDTAPSTKGGSLPPKAAAVVLGHLLYSEACQEDNPAAALDNIADNLPSVMPDVFRIMNTDPATAELLLPLLIDRVWTYTLVESCRADVAANYGDYGYAFDLLIDGLNTGADPKVIRADARRVMSVLQAERVETSA